jgi:hypothetical protein
LCQTTPNIPENLRAVHDALFALPFGLLRHAFSNPASFSLCRAFRVFVDFTTTYESRVILGSLCRKIS